MQPKQRSTQTVLFQPQQPPQEQLTFSAQTFAERLEGAVGPLVLPEAGGSTLEGPPQGSLCPWSAHQSSPAQWQKLGAEPPRIPERAGRSLRQTVTPKQCRALKATTSTLHWTQKWGGKPQLSLQDRSNMLPLPGYHIEKPQSFQMGEMVVINGHFCIYCPVTLFIFVTQFLLPC